MCVYVCVKDVYIMNLSFKKREREKEKTSRCPSTSILNIESTCPQINFQRYTYSKRLGEMLFTNINQTKLIFRESVWKLSEILNQINQIIQQFYKIDEMSSKSILREESIKRGFSDNYICVNYIYINFDETIMQCTKFVNIIVIAVCQ